MAEVVIPDAEAIALTVRLVVTLIGPVYTGELAVGALPSWVYRMVAPGVDVVMVTDWVPVYVPPGGLSTGVATVPPPPVPPWV
jgi:hypothetical protein